MIPDTTSPSASGSLRVGVLGPFQIAFFVVSAAGPLIAMAGGIPVAMLFGNGAGLPALFVAGCLILLAFARGYTAMARHVRNSGAFYAFAAQGLGGHAAGATGVIALASYTAIQLAIYGLFGAAVAGLLASTGLVLPWWSMSLAAMALIAILGYRQIDLSARILGLLVALEYLSIFILDFTIVRANGTVHVALQPFQPATIAQGSPAIGLLLCFSAFIGFEATTIYSEEARDPARTIPLATYLSVLLIGGFYTVSTWAMVIGIGPDRVTSMLHAVDPTTVLFTMSDRFVGAWLTGAMRILFVTSAFASLLAFHNSIARYLYAMGRERLLFHRLGATHRLHRSPHIASLVQTGTVLGPILAFAACGADPVLVVFTMPSGLGTLGIIVLMAITSLAAWRFLRRRASDTLTLLLTVFSCVSFLTIAMFATVRFDLLAGGAGWAIRLLPLLLLVAGITGLMLAERLRRTAPEAYGRLGVSRDL